MDDTDRILEICARWNINSEKLEKMIATCERQYNKIQDQKLALQEVEAEARELRDQLRREAAIRPSLEVLQRMANGIDPFDRGRFQAAVAALPHETPKLSASVSAFGTIGGIGERLDRAKARARLQLVGPDGPDAA